MQILTSSNSLSTDPLAQADRLAATFAETAVERDQQGGTPMAERQAIRESGLLNLLIPEEYGGMGDRWTTALEITRRFAQVDSSIAHVFSYHHLGIITPHIFGTPEQKAYYYTETARQGWFWCNALNPRDRRTTLTRDGDRYVLNGAKSFCSGSVDSDMLPVTATDDDGNLRVLALPTRREGITVHHDWDNMGQRQTDSGSVTFEQVIVSPTEILSSSAQPKTPFQTFRSCLTQITFTNIYLGLAQGAFAAAKHYTQTSTRPWISSTVDAATADPYILHHYGELWVNLTAATCLADRAGTLLQAAWEQQQDLTAEQRGDCAVAIATAKVAATKVGLDIATRMFDVMGARATSNQHGFDRYWRNLRTFTLHDPVDYKLRDLGNWALNQTYPTPDFYA